MRSPSRRGAEEFCVSYNVCTCFWLSARQRPDWFRKNTKKHVSEIIFRKKQIWFETEPAVGFHWFRNPVSETTGNLSLPDAGGITWLPDKGDVVGIAQLPQGASESSTEPGGVFSPHLRALLVHVGLQKYESHLVEAGVRSVPDLVRVQARLCWKRLIVPFGNVTPALTSRL